MCIHEQVRNTNKKRPPMLELNYHRRLCYGEKSQRKDGTNLPPSVKQLSMLTQLQNKSLIEKKDISKN